MSIFYRGLIFYLEGSIPLSTRSTIHCILKGRKQGSKTNKESFFNFIIIGMIDWCHDVYTNAAHCQTLFKDTSFFAGESNTFWLAGRLTAQLILSANVFITSAGCGRQIMGQLLWGGRYFLTN